MITRACTSGLTGFSGGMRTTARSATGSRFRASNYQVNIGGGVNKWIVVLMVALLTAGCSTTGGDKRCSLLAIAYDEQDQLAGPWYEEADAELRKCGYENTGDPKRRGRDSNGFYNADKE